MNATEKKLPDLSELLPVEQAAQIPALRAPQRTRKSRKPDSKPPSPEARVRWLVFNAERLGIEEAIFRLGGRVLIWPAKLVELMAKQRSEQ